MKKGLLSDAQFIGMIKEQEVGLDPARRAAFEAYLDLERAGHSEGMPLMTDILVRPVAVQADKSDAILVLSAPSEIMVGQSQGNGPLLGDDDRFMIAAPPAVGPSVDGV